MKSGLTGAAVFVALVLGKVVLNDRTRLISRMEAMENHLRDKYTQVITENTTASRESATPLSNRCGG